MTREKRLTLLREMSARFDAELWLDEHDAPLLTFAHGLSDDRFRGWQRSLRGRYRLAWMDEHQHDVRADCDDQSRAA